MIIVITVGSFLVFGSVLWCIIKKTNIQMYNLFREYFYRIDLGLSELVETPKVEVPLMLKWV